MNLKAALVATAAIATLLVGACGGGGDGYGGGGSGPRSGAGYDSTYTVGGTVSGLTGTVVLQDNGTDNLTISANGWFTFGTPIGFGTSYAVTVLKQPMGGQACTVTNGMDTMGASNITNVTVTCN